MNSIAMEMPSELHNLPYDEAEEVRARVDEAQIVTLENVGAIERLEFPVSPKGGVVIFKGRNGSGKSTRFHVFCVDQQQVCQRFVMDAREGKLRDLELRSIFRLHHGGHPAHLNSLWTISKGNFQFLSW
ncbi:MAG: hypothetical protein IJD43_05050 [Thermoguttaceae bacterium]|nr:hypothetical protein [Thermoguttaceae bacterium]